MEIYLGGVRGSRSYILVEATEISKATIIREVDLRARLALGAEPESLPGSGFLGVGR
jgi:hypothetical protein